ESPAYDNFHESIDCSMSAASMTARPNSSLRVKFIHGAISAGSIGIRILPAFRRRVVSCSTTPNSTTRCQRSRGSQRISIDHRLKRLESLAGLNKAAWPPAFRYIDDPEKPKFVRYCARKHRAEAPNPVLWTQVFDPSNRAHRHQRQRPRP